MITMLLYLRDGHWCGMGELVYGPYLAGLRLPGPGPDRKIHDLGRLVHGLKILGPQWFVTGFHSSKNGPWA